MSNNFIKELKYSELKNKTIKFVLNNIEQIIAVTIAIVVISLSFFLFSYYKKQAIKKANAQLFEIMSIENSQDRIKELNKIFNSEKSKETAKNFAGLQLAQEYAELKNEEKMIDVYTRLFNTSKDEYVKNLAGINVLIAKINAETLNKDEIAKLLTELENKKNPFIDLVIEQKAIFYIKQNNTEEAKKIISKLLEKENLEVNLRDRLRMYMLSL